ncbi:MAG: hypothetical protein IJK46_07920 [Prevotella sp.]|nr:hypothetical protein [Prevotella sp.]
MGFRGRFEWFTSLHQGGKRAISFTLTCKNMLLPETFDCAIIDSTGNQPTQIRRHLKLKPNESFTFNYDSCGWDWCQGDFFAILGKNDKIKKRWDLNLKIYGRGECPECHGSHRCIKCNGTGTVKDIHNHTISACSACNGTGICQKCYVPMHLGTNLANDVYGGIQMPNPTISREHAIAELQQSVSDLQKKIEKAECDIRMMQLKGIDTTSRSVYSSQLELVHQYTNQLIKMQNELRQLINSK